MNHLPPTHTGRWAAPSPPPGRLLGKSRATSALAAAQALQERTRAARATSGRHTQDDRGRGDP
ncbi:MAG TPA: hypothetical protein VFP72_03500 [Kineosporiaceae bacterium]|nr:hypothetical protein [Kineosporiaceae bacterium]